MNRFAAFLGILMVLSFLLACASPASSPPTEEATIINIEKLETFQTTGTHSSAVANLERPPAHDLSVTFYRIGKDMSAVVMCVHGSTVIDGDDAFDLYQRLSKPKSTKSSYSASQTGAARMWGLLEVVATRSEGGRLST